MSYRTKKDVLSNISTRRKRRDGVEYTTHDAYLGYDPYTGKQVRMQSSDLAELKARIERFYVEYRAGGDAAARLKPHEATDAREAIDLLAAHGKRLSLAEVVRNWLDGSGSPEGASKSVEKTPEGRGKTLGEAYDAFMESLVGRSKIYERTLKSRLGAFVDDFGRETGLDCITAGAVVKSLEGRLLDRNDDRTWKTYNNHLGDIKTFFGWCAKSTQKYIEASPVAEVEKLVIPYHDPEYVRAEDIGRLFEAIVRHSRKNPADLADAILSFFCGMRQCEIARIRNGEKSAKIVLDAPEPFIRIVEVKGATRGERPRVIRFSDQALAWIRSFDFASAVTIPNKQFRRHLVEYAGEAGIALPANAGRHTFITMHAAAYHDQNLLSSIVGNTEGVRANSYDGVEVETNGRAYFAITPESLWLKTS